MYFLIDYENVKNAGMHGSEHLLQSDHVILFYSDSSHTMEMRHLENIQKNDCYFEVCKLVKVGKNALDFYIATKLGEIFGTGVKDNVIIVSRDTGFQAVKDYWAKCSTPSRNITISESIERGIISANESGERRILIQNLAKAVDISSFYAVYERNRLLKSSKLRNTIKSEFIDTEFLSKIDEMENIVNTCTSTKELYQKSLHHFGRKDGSAIYEKLKKHSEFLGQKAQQAL